MDAEQGSEGEKLMITIKVMEMGIGFWGFGIFEDAQLLMSPVTVTKHSIWRVWRRKDDAIQNAEIMAEKTGIPYSNEIVTEDEW